MVNEEKKKGRIKRGEKEGRKNGKGEKERTSKKKVGW